MMTPPMRMALRVPWSGGVPRRAPHQDDPVRDELELVGVEGIRVLGKRYVPDLARFMSSSPAREADARSPASFVELPLAPDAPRSA